MFIITNKKIQIKNLILKYKLKKNCSSKWKKEKKIFLIVNYKKFPLSLYLSLIFSRDWEKKIFFCRKKKKETERWKKRETYKFTLHLFYSECPFTSSSKFSSPTKSPQGIYAEGKQDFIWKFLRPLASLQDSPWVMGQNSFGQIKQSLAIYS